MTRKQTKALRRSKAIKKKQNIIKRAKSAAAVAVASAVFATPNISAQDHRVLKQRSEEIVVTSRKK